jgi:paraquat-inducible protein B
MDLKEMSAKITRTAESVEALVSSPEAKQMFANLNSAITEARAAIAKLDGQVGPVTDDLKKTLADAQAALKTIDGAAATTRRFIEEQGPVGDEITSALRQIAAAAESLQRLADLINRNPNALLVGTKKK